MRGIAGRLHQDAGEILRREFRQQRRQRLHHMGAHGGEEVVGRVHRNAFSRAMEIPAGDGRIGEALVLLERIAIRHAGEVVAHRARRGLAAGVACLVLPPGRQQAGLAMQQAEQDLQRPLAFLRGAVDAPVAVHALEQEGAEFVVRLHHRVGEGDHGAVMRADIGGAGGLQRGDSPAGFRHHVVHHGVDDASYDLAGRAVLRQCRVLLPGGVVGGLHQRQRRRFLQREQPGLHAVIEVRVVVGDVIGQCRDLRLRACMRRQVQRVQAIIFDDVGGWAAQRAVMLGEALQRLPRQVQPVEAGVAGFPRGAGLEGLRIVVEAAIGLHRGIQRILPGMAEGGMAEVVGDGQRLRQIFLQRQFPGDGARDLRDFQAVGQARPEMVAFVVDEDLGLVLQAPEGGGVDDAVAVALEGRTCAAGGLGMQPAP